MTSEEKAGSEHNPTGRRIAPIVLWILVGTSLAIFIYSLFSSPPTSITSPPSWSYAALQEVKGGIYSHKEVVLDGHRWVDCNFDGATLYYDGTAPTEMISCSINNATLTSHSQAIALTIAIMNSFQKAGGPTQPCAPATPLPPRKTHLKSTHRR
jgi:hypothetical protein